MMPSASPCYFELRLSSNATSNTATNSQNSRRHEASDKVGQSVKRMVTNGNPWFETWYGWFDCYLYRKIRINLGAFHSRD